MEVRRSRVAWTAALLMMALVPPAAAGERPASLRMEARALGSAHAAEHAAEDRALGRAARRWSRLSPARRRATRRRAAAASYRSAQLSVDAPADVIGRWNAPGARVPLPTYAINAVQLPTGKVLFWGRAPVDRATNQRANTGPAFLWDPARPSAAPEDVTPRLDLDGDGVLEEAPIFCTGQSLLPDGRVFAAGGTLAYPDPSTGKDFKGLDLAFTFDPWTERWAVAGRMEHGRWYPSQVELADGRIAIYAGWDEGGDRDDNRQLEIFDWRDDSLTRHPAGDAVPAKFASFPFYPHLFTMPGGKVLIGGPDSTQSGLLDPAALGGADAGSAWRAIGGGKDGYGGLSTYYRGAGMGVIVPGSPAKAALIGGYAGSPARAQATADVIDTGGREPALERRLGRRAGDEPRALQRERRDPPRRLAGVDRRRGRLRRPRNHRRRRSGGGPGDAERLYEPRPGAQARGAAATRRGRELALGAGPGQVAHLPLDRTAAA